MSRLLCCLRARTLDMGAALAHAQDGEACEGSGVPAAPPTMADVIRERKKKAGGAGLGTLRRRLAAAARRPRAGDARPDRGCEHARFIRSVVSSWRVSEVFLLCEELEAGAALRDLATQAELARQPAPALHQDLQRAYTDRWWCDVELVGSGGWAVRAHRAVLAARCTYFRDLLQRCPSGACRVPLEGVGAALSRGEVEACVLALYAGPSALAPPAAAATASAGAGGPPRQALCDLCAGADDKWERAEGDLDIISVDNSTRCRGGYSSGCSGAGPGGAGGPGAPRVESAAARRLAALLGFSVDALHRDMRYLLDSGEYADSRLVFRLEGGCGAQYGFRSALELPCHRVLLAARSRFFRSVMSRRTNNASGNNSGAVCVDEKVLPRRFARALLHAAYTDQVDLSLIGRGSSSPSSTAGSGSGAAGWGGAARSAGGAGGGGSPRAASPSALDDAFQLYEIARFLEMPIVVQGCEDAIVEALSADTLPHVLRWAAAPHASQWVHRQAMRYLRDEFPVIMSHAGSARLPRPALAAALGSPFLQASEAQALRALLRWAERSAAGKQAADHREPNVVWHTAHSVSRRGGGARRREVGDAALREALAPLVPLVRTEHLPPDNELLQQLVRRGIVPPPALPPPPPAEEGGCAADAWLGRGPHRAPRCFLPYLDEIKALVEDQAVPEAELSRARRARFLHRIPDTLYMVSAARSASRSHSHSRAGAESAASGSAESACVSPRALAGLRARVRELRAAPPAARALALHAQDTPTVYRQICLRAVREQSLPDACADLLLAEPDCADDRERESESPRPDPCRRDPWPGADLPADCCSRGGAGAGGGGSGGGGARCGSAGSLRSHHSLHIPIGDGARPAAGRRELPPRPADSLHHRQVWDEFGESQRARACTLGPLGALGSLGSLGALSAAVPDVAMAPNANTHLLTARDYFRPAAPAHHPPAHPAHPAHHMHPAVHLAAHAHTEFGGGGLQLDLGDGATHTPRPGSRAQRAAAAHGGAARALGGAAPRQHRDHAQAVSLSCARTRLDEEELRAAVDLSVIRAYSVYHGAGTNASAAGGSADVACRPLAAGTLPPCYRAHAHAATMPTAGGSGIVTAGSARALVGPGVSPVSAGVRSRSSRSTPSPGAGALDAAAAAHASRLGVGLHAPAMRVGSAELRLNPPAPPPGCAGGRSRSPSPGGPGAPSPRRAPRERDLQLYRHHHHDYRLETNYGSSTSGSRGPSPSNYA